MPFIENLAESYLIFTKWVVFFPSRFGYFFVCIVLSCKIVCHFIRSQSFISRIFMHSINFPINVYKMIFSGKEF